MSKGSSKSTHKAMDTLQKYKEKPLYEAPDSYFDQLHQDIMQRVLKEEKQHKTYKKLTFAASVAASFILICTISFFLFINRNTNEPFYAHQEIEQSEDSIFSFDTIHFAENKDVNHFETPENSNPKELISSYTSVSNVASTPSSETIVYRAVDFYLDDYEINSFCEVMYDLECYYDY